MAHCGDSLAGDFVWNLTMIVTDICTGWTECRATWNKGADGVMMQIKAVQRPLPFPVRELCCGEQCWSRAEWKPAWVYCQSASNTFHPSASNSFHFIGLLRTIFALLKAVGIVTSFQNIAMMGNTVK